MISTAEFKRMLRDLARARDIGDLAAIAILEGKLAKIVW